MQKNGGGCSLITTLHEKGGTLSWWIILCYSGHFFWERQAPRDDAFTCLFLWWMDLWISGRLDENDPALMCYTSATTGDPKDVVCTHPQEHRSSQLCGVGNVWHSGERLCSSYSSHVICKCMGSALHQWARKKSENTIFSHSGESRYPVNSTTSGCPRIRYGAGLSSPGWRFWDFLRHNQPPQMTALKA